MQNSASQNSLTTSTSLDRLQIEFDGEPVRQSERTDLYNDAVEQWLSDDLAYVDDGAVRFRVPTEESLLGMT